MSMQSVRLSYDRAVKRGTEGDPNPEILLATRGNFSEPFFRRSRFALELAPGLVAHIVTLKVAAGGSDGERIQASKEAPLPFNEQAWDDANEVYSLLVYWCNAFAPALRLQAPGPAKHAWVNTRGKALGLPANITPQDARYVTGIMGLWLRTQLEPIMWLDPEDVTLFAQNMADVFRMSARWPQRDRNAWSKLPCPSCGGRVGIYVPQENPDGSRDHRGRLVPRGGDRRFVCEACQTSLTDAEFSDAVDREATTTKVRQELTLKYGRQIAGEWRL